MRNAVENVIIAQRVPVSMKERLEEYADRELTTATAIVRRSLLSEFARLNEMYNKHIPKHWTASKTT